MGMEAAHKYAPVTRNNTIHEVRGSVYTWKDIPCVPTYLAQDAADFKNYESEHNEEAYDYDLEGYGDDKEEGEGDVKAMSTTARKNYAFWLWNDVKKAKRIIFEGLPTRSKPDFKILPDATTTVDALDACKEWLYFDIETDYEEQNMHCFAFSSGDGTIYSVPVLDYDYKLAYAAKDFSRIFKALANSVRHNTVVAHNGHSFDSLVLAMKYRLPIYKFYDTMIAMHRCFPDVERSLGHGISLFTWENFHKDENPESYRTREDMIKKLSYCAKDVHGMILLHRAIVKFAESIPGLSESIEVGQRSVRPYLTMTMQGMRYDDIKVKAMCRENDRLMELYEKLVKILIGEVGMNEVQTAVKGKAGYFCGSTRQQAKYFHDMLGFPVIFKSPKTGLPSLGKKIMYKMQLKHDNPVIQIVNLYRKTQKETSALSFNPWRDDNGNIPPRTKEIE